MEMGATVRKSAFYYDILNLKKKKGNGGKECHGKNVSPTVRHSFVFPPRDGANLSRNVRDNFMAMPQTFDFELPALPSMICFFFFLVENGRFI